MAMRRALSLLISAVAVLAAVAGLRAAEPGPAIPADPPPGTLLIASAMMQDPRFHHSVVLLVKHDDKGAFGIIINKPVTKRPLAALLAETGNAGAEPPTQDNGTEKIAGTIEIYFGGPVGTELGFIVHSGDYHRPETVAVGSDIAMTASRAILEDIGRGKGPKQYLFALGYAGWAAGQLEGEIARREWFSTPADPDLVFDTDRDKVWDEALARRTREL